MSDAVDDIVFYWVPGCANCTRLKGYLATRGVVYRSVNIQADPAALEAMADAGHRALPALHVGGRWISGEEAEIDAALGLTPIQRSSVPPRELVERCARMLDLASDLAGQLPVGNFDDPTSTMAEFVAAGRYLADGRPYVPHGTSKSLVHHIAQHGEKAWRVLLASGGAHELGFAIDGSGDYSFFGEPEPTAPMYRVAARMRLLASDMRAWLRTDRADADFQRALDTHRGPRTMAQYLKVQTVGLLQHNRQLGDILHGLAIEPNGSVSAEDLADLNMPTGIWE